MVVQKSFGQILLPNDPSASLQAGTKQYIDSAINTRQPLDSDLTTIAALTSGSGNVMASDGFGWISKTYAALKAALGLDNVTNNAQVTLATVTAKGDVLAATASATITNVAVGSDGQVMQADSTQTAGIKWATAPAPPWSGYVETLADGSTISPNCNSGATRVGSCTSLSSSTTLNAPSNGAVGATYRAQLTASGTGPWTITLSGWVGTTDNSTTAISLPTGKTVSILGEYCGAGWLYGGYTLQA